MAAFHFRWLKWQSPQGATLPVYEQIPPVTASPTKERFSRTDNSLQDGEDDDDDLDSDYSETSTSSGRVASSPSSRHSSGSYSSATRMLPRRATFHALSRRPTRSHFYRLPNRVVRWLCVGMMATILLFMLALIRASQVENRRLAAGEVPRPKPAPPAWEKYPFLTRYYGGIRRLVPLADNVPQYPLLEDELPYNASSDPRVPPPDAGAEVQEGSAPKSKAFATDYPGSIFRNSTRSQAVECFLDAENTVRVPPIRYLEGRPSGFPDHIMGSYELLSLPEDICFERYGRYGPYGFGYPARTGGLGIGEHGDNEGAGAVWESSRQVDFRPVNWEDTQRRCYQANSGRFKPVAAKTAPPRGFYIARTPEESASHTRGVQSRGETSVPVPDDGAGSTGSSAPATTETINNGSPEPSAMPGSGRESRTAVVVRCWDSYVWKEEDKMTLRSLISELSLGSGGQYDIHLLVEVKDDVAHPIWADDDAYRVRIEASVPEEFRGLVTLWTETQMLSVYHGLRDLWTSGPSHPVHGSYRGLQMAMQYFAHNHPEYDYFWQWEMDIRYTGHHLDLFGRLQDWAAQQPRKGLWERNARFYMPSVHGSWEDFKHTARVQTEMGTSGPDNMWNGVADKHSQTADAKPGGSGIAKGDQAVWGPLRPADEGDWLDVEQDPEPPTSHERDRYQWGVGEEADLITLNPIFDPQGTTWLLADDIVGYNETAGTGRPPRRASIIAATRMSRRLLQTMHRETAHRKHHAFPEMWPATTALHHGYKAVFVPHPVFVDRQWPTELMARIFNGGRNGASGGGRTSVFGQREHNFRGLSWFYNSGFGPNLYRRWLGLEVNNDGGTEFETKASADGDGRADGEMDGSSVGRMRGGEGRMCLPPMLIHPVKDVELPIDQNLDEAFDVSDRPGPESDPTL